MTAILKIQPTRGTKMNHNESGLLVRPQADQGSKMNHNESGLTVTE